MKYKIYYYLNATLTFITATIANGPAITNVSIATDGSLTTNVVAAVSANDATTEQSCLKPILRLLDKQLLK